MFATVPVTPVTAPTAAELLATTNRRPTDALYLATANYQGLPLLSPRDLYSRLQTAG